MGLSSMIDFPGDHFLLLLPFAYERVLQSLSLVPMELPGRSAYIFKMWAATDRPPFKEMSEIDISTNGV